MPVICCKEIFWGHADEKSAPGYPQRGPADWSTFAAHLRTSQRYRLQKHSTATILCPRIVLDLAFFQMSMIKA